MRITPLTNRINPQPSVKPVAFKAIKPQPQLVSEETSLLRNFLAKIKNLFQSQKTPQQIQETVQETVQEVVKEVTPNTSKVSDIIDKKLIEIEKIIYNPLLLDEFFKYNPDINWNTKDSRGDTLILRAARRNGYKFIHTLDHLPKKYGEKDWNAVDAEGNNALMLALKHVKDGDYDSYSLIDYLDLHVDHFYINPNTKRTFLQEAIMQQKSDFVRYYLNGYSYNNRHKCNIVKHTHPDTPPALFLAFKKKLSTSTILKILELSDLDATYKDKTLFEYINFKNSTYNKEILERLEIHLAKQRLEKIKDYYKKEGIINLQQLLDYAKQPQFSSICNKPLNEIGEDVGHFLAELFPKNYEEVKQISDLIDILENNNYNFTNKDFIGRTAIEKAIEANNITVLKFLLNKMPHRTYFSLGNYNHIEKLLNEHNITDTTIWEILRKKQ